jgi:hypothetical protein
MSKDHLPGLQSQSAVAQTRAGLSYPILDRQTAKTI